MRDIIPRHFTLCHKATIPRTGGKSITGGMDNR